MSKQQTQYSRIISKLTRNAQGLTAKQLAAQFGTQEGSIRGRISELRAEGYDIITVKRKNSRNEVKTFYVLAS